MGGTFRQFRPAARSVRWVICRSFVGVTLILRDNRDGSDEGLKVGLINHAYSRWANTVSRPTAWHLSKLCGSSLLFASGITASAVVDRGVPGWAVSFDHPSHGNVQVQQNS